MKRFLLTLLTALTLIMPGALSGTEAATASSTHRKVWVKGYVRKDGAYVPGHYRTVSGSSASHGSSSGSGSSHSSPTASRPGASHRTPSTGSSRSGGPRRCTTCPRDENGRIARSGTARSEFMRRTGYPHGRPGYVVDHIVPLACGGQDTPSNMQWQTIAAARAKDRTERACVH